MLEEASKHARSLGRARVSIGQSIFPLLVLHAWRERDQMECSLLLQQPTENSIWLSINAASYSGIERVDLGLKLRYAR